MVRHSCDDACAAGAGTVRRAGHRYAMPWLDSKNKRAIRTMPAAARHPHRRHTLTGLLFGVLIGNTSPGVAAHTPMDPAWPGQGPDGSLLSVLLDGGSLSLDRTRPLDQGSGEPLAPVLSAIAGTGATGQSATLPPGADPAARVRVQQGYGRLPMHFEPNVGQTDEAVRYLARGPGYTLFLTDTEAVLVLRQGHRMICFEQA
mgnify:CR=1 FL=1